jgi:hypothetical protein
MCRSLPSEPHAGAASPARDEEGKKPPKQFAVTPLVLTGKGVLVRAESDADHEPLSRNPLKGDGQLGHAGLP